MKFQRWRKLWTEALVPKRQPSPRTIRSASSTINGVEIALEFDPPVNRGEAMTAISKEAKRKGAL